MFSNLTTKLAMRKLGISNKDLALPTGSLPGLGDVDDSPSANKNADAANNGNGKAWPPAWMSVKALPLSVQPWLAPPPAPIPVATACPKPGDVAPLDRDRRLPLGGGKPVLVIFLRCVGCAFAQQSFLALRTLANRYAGRLTCVAVSHSSATATQKWIDLLGGAWNIQVLIDEDRALYAAWGLGLGSVWYVLNPSTQIKSWRQTGWLGQSVASFIEQRGGVAAVKGGNASGNAVNGASNGKNGNGRPNAAAGSSAFDEDEEEHGGPTTIMGNKWQESGAFAIDGLGTVVWGRKAAKADDVIQLDEALPALRL